MWDKVAQFIIRFRLALIVLIVLVTAVMGYFATKVEEHLHFLAHFGGHDRANERKARVTKFNTCIFGESRAYGYQRIGKGDPLL